jgi:hypothetical protein
MEADASLPKFVDAQLKIVASPVLRHWHRASGQDEPASRHRPLDIPV